MGEQQLDENPATVTCLRCGATWPQGAVVCFKCGAPIGETAVNTQPVSTLSASPPPPPELVAEIEAENAAYAAQEQRPRRPALTPAQRRARTAMWLRLARNVAIVAVVLGLGVWAYRTVTATPPVPSKVTYHDPQHRFSLSRPALWVATAESDGVLLTDGAGTCSLRVSMRPAGKAETSARAIADALAASQSLSGAPGETIGGVKWEQRGGTHAGVDGVTRQTAIFVTLRQGTVSQITETCPLVSFSGTDNLVFAPARASFSFS
jgi:hypothetical protein